MTGTPFLPRPPDQPAWWSRPATAEEFDAVERQRRATEIAQGIRRESDGETA